MGTGVSASYRYDGSINEANWAVIGRPQQVEYVEGCAVSAGGGTRQAVVASGTVWSQNGYDTVSGATLTLSENTSGMSRIDYVCLLIDYTSDDSSLVVVEGTPAASPVPPSASLQRTAGVSWHVPLAEVTVASGAGVLSGSDLNDVRPGPWIDVTFRTGWSNFVSSDWQDGQRRLTPLGDVEMRGMVITAATLSTINPICDIPYGWRPTNDETFVCIGHPKWEPDDRVGGEGLVRVSVYPDDGYLAVTQPNRTDAYSSRWVSLSGIRWTTT